MLVVDPVFVCAAYGDGVFCAAPLDKRLVHSPDAVAVERVEAMVGMRIRLVSVVELATERAVQVGRQLAVLRPHPTSSHRIR